MEESVERHAHVVARFRKDARHQMLRAGSK
jgi:hypothetical protein